MNPGETFHSLTILSRCGGGAFGEVYFCQDISGRKMAVKIVSKTALGKAWERELKGVINYRKITEQSPELLQIYHVEEDSDCFFYTMEAADSLSAEQYVPDTLAGRIQNGPLPPETIFRTLKEIFHGIRTIHRAGFAHRDIKPDNILFVKGTPKLGDIGLLSSLSTTMTQLAGTLEFLPPEVRSADTPSSNEKQTRQRSDLYAFGKVIYCCVTGEEPQKFPSVPRNLNSYPVTKYFLRLAFRLCNKDAGCRIEDQAELETEFSEIERKLRCGESWKDELKYHAGNLLRSCRAFWKSLPAFMEKHIIISGLALVLIFVCGYIIIENRSLRTGITKDIQELAEFNEKNPPRERKMSFCNGRYSLKVPADWDYLAKNEIVTQKIKEAQKQNPNGMPKWFPGHIRHTYKDYIGVFFTGNGSPKMSVSITYNDYTGSFSKGKKKSGSAVSIAQNFLNERDFANVSDSELTAFLQPHFPDIQNLRVKRQENPRTKHRMIFLNGHTASGDGYMAYLYPDQDRSFQISIQLQGDRTEQDSIQFMRMADSFDRHNTTPLIRRVWK